MDSRNALRGGTRSRAHRNRARLNNGTRKHQHSYEKHVANLLVTNELTARFFSLSWDPADETGYLCLLFGFSGAFPDPVLVGPAPCLIRLGEAPWTLDAGHQARCTFHPELEGRRAACRSQERVNPREGPLLGVGSTQLPVEEGPGIHAEALRHLGLG